MAAEEEIAVKVAAKTEGFADGLGQATSVVKSTCTQMEGHFSGLGKAIDNLKTPFLAITGLLAGGKIFKDAISESVKWTGEVNKLSRSMGVSLEQASAFKVAMHTLGIEQDTMTGISARLSMLIGQGAAALEKQGIKVKDNSGHLKNNGQIIMDIANKYGTFATQQDKNAFLASIFGRRMQDAQQIVRLTSERLAEAAKEAKAFGLEVGPDGVAQAKEYKESLNQVSLIGLAFGNMIGKELMPTLTTMGKWMGEEGPSLLHGFGYALKGVAQIFLTLKAVIETIAIAMMAVTTIQIEGWKMVGLTINAITHGNFKEAVQVAKDGAKAIKNEWAAAADGIAEAWAKHNNASKNLWNGQPKKTGGKPEATGASFDVDAQKQKDPEGRMKIWATELKTMADMSAQFYEKLGQHREMDLSEEKAYWQTKLSTGDLTEKERLAVTAKIAALDKAIRKEQFEAEIADLHAKQDAAKTDYTMRCQMIMQEAGKYADGTKQKIDALKKLQDAEREHAEELKRIENDLREAKQTMWNADMDDQRSIIQHRYDMGEISAQQQLQMERKLIEQRFAMDRAALVDQLENGNLTEEAWARVYSKLEQIDQQKNLALEKNTRDVAKVQKGYWDGLVDSAGSAITNMFVGMANGTMTWAKGVKSVLNAVLQSFITMAAQAFTQHVVFEGLKTLFTAKATAARTGIQATGAATGTAIEAGAASKSILMNAWVAAAGAYAAISGIPIVGPVMAPAAAAVALGGVMAMIGKLSSAEGGWGQVPSDQLAAIHKNEMVLPAKFAGPLRDMLEGGGMPGGGQGGDTHIHINAVDAKSVERLFQDHGSALVKVLHGKTRNFAFAGGSF